STATAVSAAVDRTAVRTPIRGPPGRLPPVIAASSLTPRSCPGRAVPCAAGAGRVARVARMPRSVLVLQHAPWETPGLVATALAAGAGGVPVAVRSVLDGADPDLPPAARLAGLVVMGGPMGADDDARHPGLAAERRLLADAVAAEVPVLGVCL